MSSINRKAHCLKREKTLAIPRDIIMFDTESTIERLANGDNKQFLRLGWACHYKPVYAGQSAKAHWLYFDSPASFWAFVSKYIQPKRKLWVISHNLNYDFTIVQGWSYLKAAGYKLKFFHNNGVTSIITVRSKQGSILFLDSMNWFPESLAKLGLRVGVPKIDVDFENCTDERLSLHCKRDVEILLTVIKDFIKFLMDNKVCRLCYTRASTAMAAYLLNYYDTKIYIHNNQQAVDLERASYRGGRTECFCLGEFYDKVYYIVDVNSLYPTVMVDNQYPVKYEKFVTHLSTRDLRLTLRDYSCVAHVLVETIEPVYAVKHTRTIFPIGRFWVTLTTPELKYALDRNDIVEVGHTVIYEQAPIFTRFMNHFYKLRQGFKQSGDNSYEQWCKYIMLSLYGKFGQKADIWKKIGNAPDEPDRVEVVYYPETNKRGMLRYLLGEVWELAGYEESFNSFPAISSHVTAYGRLYMFELMKAAQWGNYFYMDTDSLIVNEVGLCNLKSYLDDVKLGALKVQETTSTLYIRGLKDYSTDAKTVIKGIRQNAVEIGSGVYRQELWPSLKGMLRAGQQDGYTVKQVTKTLSREYTKGEVLEDGWIIPFELYQPF